MRLPNRFGSKSHGSVVRVFVAEGVAMIVRVSISSSVFLLHITRPRPLADRLSLLAFSTLHVMAAELLMCGGSSIAEDYFSMSFLMKLIQRMHLYNIV